MEIKASENQKKVGRIYVPKFKKELGFKTTPARSVLMSRIRSSGTKPEIQLRKELWRLGIRYRINFKKLPGRPDIVVTSEKLAIFVDGEFWHGFEWQEKKKKLKTNRKFWIPKIERNIQRDEENNQALSELGYEVLRFWEHEIIKDLDGCVKRVLNRLV